MATYATKLTEITTRFPMTRFWNDSCSVSELTNALRQGCDGATTNPVIVVNVLNKELLQWEDTIRQIVRDNPTATEDEIAWKLIETLGLTGAKTLLPVYEASKGLKGKLSIQTNAKYYRNTDLMVEQALHFHSLAPNIMVKLPASEAAIAAFEEATYRGVSINATVSFTVSQAVAVAEAVEHGLARREKEGLSNDTITPACTLMNGRTEDWLKEYAAKENLGISPEAEEMYGVAVFKNAYRIFKERGYRTQLLVAAFRHEKHWHELVGGDIILTISKGFQDKINASALPVENRMDVPVPEQLLAEMRKNPQFVLAYEPDAQAPSEFCNFGSFKKTMYQFLGSYDKLVEQLRSYIVQ